MVWLVVAISLALPSVLFLTLDNLRPLVPDLTRPAQVSVLLDRQLDLAQAESVRRQIMDWASVAHVALVGRDEALVTFGEQTGLSELLTSLDRNPLPHTLLVLPSGPLSDDALGQLIEGLSALPDVDSAMADSQWMARLNQILVAGERWGLALGGAMVLGAILALCQHGVSGDCRPARGNFGGAPDWRFARVHPQALSLYRPLFWRGRRGARRSHVVDIDPMGRRPDQYALLLYDSPGQLHGPGWRYPLALIVLGAGLGWLASWTASARYFKRLETH